MRNTKLLRAALAALLVFTSLFFSEVNAGAAYSTVGEVTDLIDGIFAYKEAESGASSLSEWASGGLAAGAGSTSEWYAISLCQYGFTALGAYGSALESYVADNSVASATSRQRLSLALMAAGRSTNTFILNTADDSIGAQGVMSWIFGLHILNNGYTSSVYSTADVVGTLLSLRTPDGGWAVSGSTADVDVTAMALQALAPHRGDGNVAAAVNDALALLSERQQADGCYMSYGAENSESCAQVITALSALGIDASQDERFQKNGITVVDAMAAFRLPDGSFCHVMDGGSNATATSQACYSLIAYYRYLTGRGSLYLFSGLTIPEREAETVSAEAVTEAETATPESAIETENRTEAATETENRMEAAADEESTNDETETATGTSAIEAKTTAAAATAGAEKTTAAPREEESGADVLSEAESGNEGDDQKTAQGPGLKFIVSLCIGGAALITSLILWLLGKRSPKNYIVIAIVATLLIFLVFFLKIEGRDEYYSSTAAPKENAVGTVTLEIRCDTVVGKSDSEYIPADGVILKKTSLPIAEGDTVFIVLTEAVRASGIQMENTGGGSYGLAYIAGLGYLYEFDFGDLSGWVYHVNDIAPSVGCGEYTLKDGDVIEWLYTCDLGEDVRSEKDTGSMR